MGARIRMVPIVLALALAADVAYAQNCVKTLDVISEMRGAAFKPTFVFYEQETAWRQFGDITKINLYYNPVEQCLKGIKPTYGSNAANAQILGTETEGTTIYTTADLTLQAGEVFIKAEYKYGTRCFEYLKLTTNNDRTLTLGNSESTNPLQTSKPAASAGYLGFVKGYTDVPNTGASTCKLQQLQLYWVTSSCSGNP